MDLLNWSGLSFAPYAAQVHAGDSSLTLVVKGTFDLVAGGTARRAESQILPSGDLPDEDDEETCRYPSDFVPIKPKADLLLVGHGRAVRFQVGSWSKRAGGAGFGPVPITQRLSKTGTYDAAWRKRQWPFLPEDFDPSFFNAAPPDQQLPHYLRGDEDLVVEAKTIFRCRLAAPRVRGFLGGLAAFPLREIPMNLDTLWIDMDAEKAVLVWRGVSNKVEGVHRALAVAEDPSTRPLPREQYEDRLLEELARRKLESIPRPPEIPALAPEPVAAPSTPPTPKAPEETPDVEGQIRDALKEAGIDPESLLHPPPLPSPSPEALKDAKLKYGIPDEEEEIPAPPSDAPAPPPPVVAAARESFAGKDLTGASLAGLDLSGVDFKEAVLRGADFAGAKLGKADFSGANLAEAKMSGVDARDARFSGADLARANLSEANLTSANLEEADLSDSNLRGAKLARAIARGARFFRAKLGDADLSGATLKEADFSEARLARATLSRADLSHAVLRAAWGPDLIAEEADFTGAGVVKADLRRSKFARIKARDSVWEEAVLHRCDFSSADLEKAELSAANLQEATLNRANLRHARLVKTILRRAKLLRTNLFRSSLEGADLTGADLRESNLYEAELWNIRAEEASILGANLKMTKMADVDH